MFLIHEKKQQAKPAAGSQKPVKTARRRSSIFLASGSWLPATVCLATFFVAGCAHRENSPPEVNVEPVMPDEAMQHRDWPQATAIYANGAVAAGPTEFNYEPKRGMPECRYYYADYGTFFVNMILLPYNLYKHPQTEVVISPGETIPPTYTAQPVLPPPGMVEPGTAPVVEPGTEPVVEPGTAPSTPPVVEPGAMAPPATPATPETTAGPTTPATEVAPAPLAPATPTPTPEAAPAPIVLPAPEATPAPAPAAAPAAAAAPAPATPEPAPNPGEVAPSTPHVIEPPPPAATKNLLAANAFGSRCRTSAIDPTQFE